MTVKTAAAAALAVVVAVAPAAAAKMKMKRKWGEHRMALQVETKRTSLKQERPKTKMTKTTKIILMIMRKTWSKIFKLEKKMALTK